MHPSILYHYTNYNGASGIKKCGYIRKSRQWANFPSGVYMTVMDPENYSQDEILINNYGRNYAERANGKLVDRADWVVKIYTDTLDSSKLKKVPRSLAGNNYRSMYMYDDIVRVTPWRVMMNNAEAFRTSRNNDWNSNDADNADYEYEYEYCYYDDDSDYEDDDYADDDYYDNDYDDDYDDDDDDYDGDWKFRGVNSVSYYNYYRNRHFNDGNDSDDEYYDRSKSYYSKGFKVGISSNDRKGKSSNTAVVATPTSTTTEKGYSTNMMISPTATKVLGSDGTTTAFRNYATVVRDSNTSTTASHSAVTTVGSPKNVLSSLTTSKVKGSGGYDDIRSYESYDKTFDTKSATIPQKIEERFMTFVGTIAERIRIFGKIIKGSF